MIFLDTGFLFALLVEGDADHDRVKPAFEPYRGRSFGGVLLTTNYIVDETVTLLRRRGHPDPKARHRLAIDVGEQLLSGVFGDVYHVTESDDQAALAYLTKHEPGARLERKESVRALGEPINSRRDSRAIGGKSPGTRGALWDQEHSGVRLRGQRGKQTWK